MEWVLEFDCPSCGQSSSMEVSPTSAPCILLERGSRSCECETPLRVVLNPTACPHLTDAYCLLADYSFCGFAVWDYCHDGRWFVEARVRVDRS
jgi:hypothetical protein